MGMRTAQFHIPDVAGRTYAVFGLARSGMARRRCSPPMRARLGLGRQQCLHGKAAAAGIPWSTSIIATGLRSAS
jgi:hypothetical protein